MFSSQCTFASTSRLGRHIYNMCLNLLVIVGKNPKVKNKTKPIWL